MQELNTRAKKNALTAITRYEKKHNISLKDRRWHIEDSQYTFSFEQLIEFISYLDYRYNCGYRVANIENEICLFCDDYLMGYTKA